MNHSHNHSQEEGERERKEISYPSGQEVLLKEDDEEDDKCCQEDVEEEGFPIQSFIQLHDGNSLIEDRCHVLIPFLKAMH